MASGRDVRGNAKDAPMSVPRNSSPSGEHFHDLVAHLAGKSHVTLLSKAKKGILGHGPGDDMSEHPRAVNPPPGAIVRASIGAAVSDPQNAHTIAYSVARGYFDIVPDKAVRQGRAARCHVGQAQRRAGRARAAQHGRPAGRHHHRRDGTAPCRGRGENLHPGRREGVVHGEPGPRRDRGLRPLNPGHARALRGRRVGNARRPRSFGGEPAGQLEGSFSDSDWCCWCEPPVSTDRVEYLTAGTTRWRVLDTEDEIGAARASVGYGSIRYMLINQEGGVHPPATVRDFDPTSFDPRDWG